jgi:chemotaxis regulatin CheY-phosphate phosphatase CheZ
VEVIMTEPEELRGRIQKEISELTAVINGIIDTFRTMKSPLEETHEQVPKATVQLDRISQQTEAATHRMLDTIESITQREEEVINELGSLKSLAGTAGDSGKEKILAELISKANANLDGAYLIMESLQFQDITAQQINHAASLLEDIEARLHQILALLEGKSLDDRDAHSSTKKVRVFDPHADMGRKKTEQADVDSIFVKAGKK